jgi:tRNA(Ile)-lysidine synthase TilS/MesJ
MKLHSSPHAGDAPIPVVSVVTAHGRQVLPGAADDMLFDVLSRHHVPWSAVSVYAIPRGGAEPSLLAGLDRRLVDIDATELLIYFNRNVNPFLVSPRAFKPLTSEGADGPATDYLYQRLDNQHSTAETFLKKLSADECRQIIADRVAETVRAHVPADADIVVGVSGGGDSNALLHGLTALRDHGLRVHPVIIKGIPDWDLGVPRAQALCEAYGLSLTVVDEAEVKELLGMPKDSLSLIDRFEREFAGDDFEFLGTLLIRLALGRHASAHATPFVCTGLNLEDLVCESLFRLSAGRKPAAFPVRTVGDLQLVFPLWQCPKRIIDGCFPKQSLENYEARYPCFSLGRNLYYSVVYAMQSQFPGFLEQFVRGLSTISLDDPVEYRFDEQLGFHVERFVPFPLVRRFQRMVGGVSM